MTRQELDYAETLSKLLELLGKEVDVLIAGADRRPPGVAYFDGVLGRGGEVYGGDLVGYHREAFRLQVGGVDGVDLTLHPDHFVTATWSEGRDRRLKVTMGGLVLEFRTGPAASDPTER